MAGTFRRRRLAERGQLRAVVACQTSTILLVALIVGIPLGIAAGRWAWTAFASEIGVVPAPVVPAAALALGAVALLAIGNLLASWPVHDLTHLHQLSRVMAHQYTAAVGPWTRFMGVMQCGGHSAPA